ncbi:MAG: hypothetical protein OEY23_26815, partial [Acidimicrobiia bacterium]|nr:hypothetical protein [Acidimicrobiia bacterium]
MPTITRAHAEVGEVCKAAATPAEVEGLHREEAILRLAATPGLVRPIRLDGSAGEATLVTEDTGGADLTVWQPRALAEVARVLAAVAAALADLHALGISHNR